MCRNPTLPLSQSMPTTQRGFLLPAAVFLLVVMGLLSTALLTISTQTAMATTQEGISIMSLNAADAGVQSSLSRLFYPVADRATTDTRCTAINGVADIAFTAAGLKTCSADIACARTTNGADTTSYYLLTSVGSCGANEVLATRTVEVTAIMED